MQLFDEYVMVDWSAVSRRKTGAGSVWIAAGNASRVVAENPSTRAAARAVVQELLVAAAGASRRVLVGFDFPYGFARGLGRALDLPSGRAWAWFRVWEELVRSIEDDDANRNNRFVVASRLNERLGPEPGPFWMRPHGAGTPALALTRPVFPYETPTVSLPEFRATELALKRRGRQPQSPWKLSGAGSVGSQALLGIPVVHALRFDPELASVSRVWPFETGFVPEPAGTVVHAEIWPGVVEIDPREGEVRDATQVKALVAEFARRDAEGTLGELFVPLDADDAAAHEEGWILGA
jgi:precorrin-8X/cobalt-precorrin-8 methylmutase